MTATEWPARVVGDRLLCGRRLLATGEFNCQGEIAALMYRSGGSRFPYLRGFVENPPGSGWWEPSRTAAEKLAVGRRPAYKVTSRNRRYAARPPALPFRRKCPHCKCTALVDSVVLDSQP